MAGKQRWNELVFKLIRRWGYDALDELLWGEESSSSLQHLLRDESPAGARIVNVSTTGLLQVISCPAKP